MRDNNLIFHDGTNFTATVTPVSTVRAGGSAVLDVGKSGIAGLFVQLCLTVIIVGAGGTIDAKVQYSDSATFASGVETGPSWPQLTTATAATYRRTLLCQSKRRYWRVVMTTGGTVTTETVLVHIVSGPDRDDTA